MAAVAAAAQAGPVGPNLPLRRDPYYAGKWHKPKSERYVETQSGVGCEEGIEELSFPREKNIHVNLERRAGGH